MHAILNALSSEWFDHTSKPSKDFSEMKYTVFFVIYIIVMCREEEKTTMWFDISFMFTC